MQILPQGTVGCCTRVNSDPYVHGQRGHKRKDFKVFASNVHFAEQSEIKTDEPHKAPDVESDEFEEVPSDDLPF